MSSAPILFKAPPHTLPDMGTATSPLTFLPRGSHQFSPWHLLPCPPLLLRFLAACPSDSSVSRPSTTASNAQLACVLAAAQVTLAVTAMVPRPSQRAILTSGDASDVPAQPSVSASA